MAKNERPEMAPMTITRPLPKTAEELRSVLENGDRPEVEMSAGAVVLRYASQAQFGPRCSIDDEVVRACFRVAGAEQSEPSNPDPTAPRPVTVRYTLAP